MPKSKRTYSTSHVPARLKRVPAVQKTPNKPCHHKVRTILLVLGLLVTPSCFITQTAQAQITSPSIEQAPTSITVHDSIVNTLDYHNDLKVLQENRQAAIHELRRSKAGWGPRVDVSARIGASALSDSTTRPDNADGWYEASRVGARLVQPIWDGNATLARVHASEGILESVSHRVLDNANSLALDGIIAHIDLLWRNKIQELAEKNVAQHIRIYKATSDRAKLGADTLGEVSQTEGRLSRARSTLIDAQTSLKEGQNAYQRMTGLVVTPAQLTDVTMPSTNHNSIDLIIDTAMKENPKIKAYCADIKYAQSEKEISQSAFLPTFNLEASPYYSDREGNGEQWSSNLDVMATMNWNIFNSGADKAATEASNARIRQAQQTLRSYKDELMLHIRNAWAQHKAALAKEKYYAEAVTHYTTTRDAYLDQFMIGQRSLLDVLDAESELFSASTQHVTAESNVLISSYKLLALTGTLLTELGINQDNYLAPPKKEQQ